VRGRGGGAAEAYMHPARRLRAAPPHTRPASVCCSACLLCCSYSVLYCVIAC
jgi:hypothetical protein